jgi:5-formyltetrahydrofolate cyclo-ligase
MTKKELRSIYRERRTALSEAEFARLEKKVADRLLGLPTLWQSHCVHTYLPIRSKREIDTWPVVRWLWMENIKVNVPALARDMPLMECIELDATDQLEMVEWGVEEPVVKRKAGPEHIDAAIVPLLCFDTRGYRVGYGKGYYDRFFEVAPRCLKIGLSLFGPEPMIDDTNDNDVPLDMCVTPDKVYVF